MCWRSTAGPALSVGSVPRSATTGSRRGTHGRRRKRSEEPSVVRELPGRGWVRRRAFGQACQPRQVAVGQLAPDPPASLEGKILSAGDERIPVAAHGHLACLPAQPDRLSTTRTLADQITQIDDPGDAADSYIRQHRFQRGDVTVYIGDDGDLLKRPISWHRPSLSVPSPPAKSADTADEERLRLASSGPVTAAGGVQAAGRAGRCGGVAGLQALVRCRNSQDALVTAIARMAAQHAIAIQAS
jgi:hypothetical protein